MAFRLRIRLLGGLLSLASACGNDPAFQTVTKSKPQDKAGLASQASPASNPVVAPSGELDANEKVSSVSVANPGSGVVATSSGANIPDRGSTNPTAILAVVPPSLPASLRTDVLETPLSAVLETSSIAVRAGESRTLTDTISNPAGEALRFSFAPGSAPENLAGSISSEGIYRAPDNVTQPLQVRVAVSSGTRSVGEIAISLIPKDTFVVVDDKETQGLVGNVYDFGGRSVSKIPNYDDMTPVATVLMPDVHVPLRTFSVGFPGVGNLFEWFGIRFASRIKIDTEGDYTFSLDADDGARFYIGNMLVVDNDGLHSSQSRSGQVHLSRGLHPMRLDYFQGPRHHIQLELFWVKPGQTSRELVPAANFHRPSEP